MSSWPAPSEHSASSPTAKLDNDDYYKTASNTHSPAPVPLDKPPLLQELLRKNSTMVAVTSEAALGTSQEELSELSKISAYARLDFDNYTFFVQTLQVVLGRKANDEPVLSSHHSVDVHLSSKKAISRRHAKIFYNFGTQRFEISILGRNGAFVDDTFVEKGMTVPLADDTKIQIGDIPFVFVLPSVEPQADEKKPGIAFNPSDALNLRTNLYLTSPIRDKKKTALNNVKEQEKAERRNSRADIVRRLSTARRKSLASSSNDEISALLKELETIGDVDEDEDATLDAEIRELLRDREPTVDPQLEALSGSQLQREEDEIDELVKQHNLQQGVVLDRPHKDIHDIDMDISILDLEIATLAPLIDAHNQELLREKEEQRKMLEIEKRRVQSLKPMDGMSRPLMGKPAAPRMGKPATIQPPANRAYGRQPVPTYGGYQAYPYSYNGSMYPAMMPTRPPPPKLEVVVETVGFEPKLGPLVPIRAISTGFPSKRAPICVFKTVEPAPIAPKTPNRRREPLRRPPKVSTHEVPDQFKAKPALSIPAMISSVLRSENGSTLAEIHDAIRNVYLYYKFCPDGWQSTVSHNVRFNKMFKVVSKLGVESDWRWAVDSEYVAEKEATRKKQQEVVMARAKEAALKTVELRQQRVDIPNARYTPYSYQRYPSALPPTLEKPKSIAELASEIRRDGPNTPAYFQRLTPFSPAESSTIKGQLAANRSRSATVQPLPTPEKVTMNADTKKSLAYLQKELFTLYKARKLSYTTAVTTEIITKALATTIAQVNIIGAKAGCGDNALSFLVEKAPQQVSKILDIALTKSIKEKQAGSKPASRENTPAPGSASPPETRAEMKSEARPEIKPSGLSKPPSFAGGLSRPHFSGKPTFSKPGALLKPPQFLSNKPMVEKRPAEDSTEPNKVMRTEE